MINLIDPVVQEGFVAGIGSRHYWRTPTRQDIHFGAITFPAARLWESGTRPNLYLLRASSQPDHPPIFSTDTRTIAFGFRSFTVDGIDPNNPNSNAVFRLNGKRTQDLHLHLLGLLGTQRHVPRP